jgi:hypothetical protein
MKSYTVVAVALVLVADVQGFAPVSSQGKVVSTQLQGTLFDAVAGMDLFAPKKDQNTYGARNKKDVSNTTALWYCKYMYLWYSNEQH